MLSLNFPLLDSSIQLNCSTILVLKKTEIFSNIVKLFAEYTENNELKLYDHKYASLKESQLLVITDILGYSFHSASMVKLIYTDLESQLNDVPEIKSELERLTIEINNLITTQLLQHELNLESQEPTLTSLFASYNVKIATYYQSIFEKCLELIHVFKYLRKKKLLVFINICSYLTEKEMATLLEEISLVNISVLFIEPNEVYQFQQYVMDEDYCLFEIKP